LFRYSGKIPDGKTEEASANIAKRYPLFRYAEKAKEMEAEEDAAQEK
jgi:hypothetical protein